MVEAVARFGYAGTTLRELVRHRRGLQVDLLRALREQAGLLPGHLRDDRRPGLRAGRRRLPRGWRSPRAAGRRAGRVHEPRRRRAGRGDAGHGRVADSGQRRHRASRTGPGDLRADAAARASSTRLETGSVSAATVRAIAAGIRGRRLPPPAGGNARASCPGSSRSWPTGRSPTSGPRDETVRRAAAAAAEPRAEAAAGNGGELDWTEPPDSPRSRAELTQRERIVRAVGRLVVDRRLRDAQHPRDLRHRRNLEPDLLRALRQQTRGLPRRLRRQRRRGAGGDRGGIRGGGRPAGGDRRGAAGDARAHRRQRALRPPHLLRPADRRARSPSTAPTR